MDRELDLSRSLRPGLDILANEIVIALKKRSRFKQNLEIYQPGLVAGHPEKSLLEYELAGTEALHAELGRYAYAWQEAFSELGDVRLVIQRSRPKFSIPPYQVNYAPRLLEYYFGWIRSSCAAGSDSDTFGETVTADVNALQNLYERINLGKLVAETKLTKNPEAYRATGGDAGAIRKLVVDPEREKSVLALAEHLARHYEFEVDQMREFARWLIAATTEVQIRYLQFRLRSE